jgi:CheY-like chemotaxis protein
MTGSRILVVEDNQDNRDLVRFLLENAGYQVLVASTGSQGLEIAGRELPDLILMDLTLPVMDGWTAARQLKTDPKTMHIPLLALTAHTLPGDRQRALEAGFNGYISKPINISKFNDAISYALQRKKNP